MARCRYPGVTEHALCTMVSTLVSGRTLHDFARGLRLEHYLALNADDQYSLRGMSGYAGGMLADAFEALLGALFMDRGYPVARAFVLRLVEVCPLHCSANLCVLHRTPSHQFGFQVGRIPAT